MEEAHVIIKALEDTLKTRGLGTADFRAEVVELFSGNVFNAVEHGMMAESANTHVRHLPEPGGAGPGLGAVAGPGNDPLTIVLDSIIYESVNDVSEKE